MTSSPEEASPALAWEVGDALLLATLPDGRLVTVRLVHNRAEGMIDFSFHSARDLYEDDVELLNQFCFDRLDELVRVWGEGIGTRFQMPEITPIEHVPTAEPVGKRSRRKR